MGCFPQATKFSTVSNRIYPEVCRMQIAQNHIKQIVKHTSLLPKYRLLPVIPEHIQWLFI